MLALTCKRVRFFSIGDEAAFFGFAGGIKAVRDVTGVRDEIVLIVVPRPSEASLRDLIALFHRFSVDKGELRQFCSAKNRRWFRDPRAFWFKKVFRNGKKA